MTQLTTNHDGALAMPANIAPTTVAARFSDVSQLTKPRITLMVVITAFIGYALAVRQQAGLIGVTQVIASSGLTLIGTLIGTALSCMGAAALNQVMERDSDALMHRTQDRPLPAGRMGASHAATIGVTLAAFGVGALYLLANPLTAALSAFTIASYVLLYTPMKRVSSISTIVGAVPGAMPPVMGYAAASGEIGVAAVLMFAILFLWQLPHFLAIAWLYRDDYARAGMPMLPVLDPQGGSTFRQVLLGCLALLPLGLMPTMMGISGRVYFLGALMAGLIFLASGVALILGRSHRHARVMFFVSLLYLPTVFALMLMDQV